MAKLGQGLITKKDALWVRVMRAKYNCGTLMIQRGALKRQCSNAWKGDEIKF